MYIELISAMQTPAGLSTTRNFGVGHIVARDIAATNPDVTEPSARAAILASLSTAPSAALGARASTEVLLKLKSSGSLCSLLSPVYRLGTMHGGYMNLRHFQGAYGTGSP